MEIEAKSGLAEAPAPRLAPARQDPAWVRWGLTALALGLIGVLIVVPVVNVFVQAFSDGPAAYWTNLVRNPDTLHAIKLTLTVAPAAVLLNTAFGVMAAWAI